MLVLLPAEFSVLSPAQESTLKTGPILKNINSKFYQISKPELHLFDVRKNKGFSTTKKTVRSWRFDETQADTLLKTSIKCVKTPRKNFKNYRKKN